MNDVTPDNQKSATQNKGGKRKYTKAKKPRGRPRKAADEQRTMPILVYFDKETYEGIVAICEADGRSKSSVVYDFVVNGGYKEPLDAEETKLLRSLYNMANNLNQLARQANTYGMYDQLARQTSSLANDISELIVKLNEKI